MIRIVFANESGRYITDRKWPQVPAVGDEVVFLRRPGEVWRVVSVRWADEDSVSNQPFAAVRLKGVPVQPPIETEEDDE
jgi:hypothetical protein